MQGHQDTKPIIDKEGKILPLTRAAKINIDCDKRAGEYRRNPEECRRPEGNPQMLTEVKVYFASEKQICVEKLDNQIMLHRHGKKLKKKLIEKFHWPPDVFQSIDWKNHGEAVRKLDGVKYLNVAKSIFGWQAVNENQHDWFKEKNPTDKCPTCNKCTETQEHVHQCNHPASRKGQREEIKKNRKLGRKTEV